MREHIAYFKGISLGISRNEFPEEIHLPNDIHRLECEGLKGIFIGSSSPTSPIFFFNSFIGVLLLYNGVLVSAL